MDTSTRPSGAVLYDGEKWFPHKQGYYRNRLGQQMHRRVWECERGPIPDGYEIHHIDGDGYNNDLSNLMCVTRSEHCRIEPRNTDPTIAREASHIRDVQKVCVVCNRPFVTRRAGKTRTRYCSRECRQKAGGEARKSPATCEICGKGFMRGDQAKSGQTCGYKCGWELRRRRQAAKEG